MRIQFWGVRGSIPAPLSSNEIEDKLIRALLGAKDVDLSSRRAVKEYVTALPPLARGTVGGNTPCLSVEIGDEWIVLDAGSGIRNLGVELMKREFGQGKGVAHILISHTHWDHIQGFPFFRPLFVPGNRITVYSPIPNLEQRFQNQQISDYFPKMIDEIVRADLAFVQLPENTPATIAGIQVNTILQAHPGRSYGYRLDGEGTAIVYASDAEFKNLGQAHTQRYVDFIRGADMLIFDAQYTLDDSFQRVDWGHSSSLIGVDMAVRAGVKRLMLFHYEHVYSDAQVQEILDSTLKYIESDPAQPACEVHLAMEGTTWELGWPEQITLKQKSIGDTVVLTIGGRFDATSVSRVDERLTALISDGLKTGLVIDLSEMTHLSIAGLKTLLNAQQMGQGVPLVLASARENVSQVLAQVGLTSSSPFEQYGTVKDAVSALEARQYLQLEGQLLHGRYRVQKALDISDKAGIFKAFDTWIERPVTIKVLSKSLGEQTEQMLLDEARALARLDHPNIVSVYDCVEYRDHLYLVREFVEGQVLRSWLKHVERVPSARALSIARAVLSGLAYAHQRGIVHRYVQPKNIILSDDETKIMNFGLADHPEEVWSPGDIVYMSPEQLAQGTLDVRSDLYSFGVLFYELLTRRLPFSADTVEEMIEQCTHTPPIPPREANRKIPVPLERTILSLLAKNPEKRQPSALTVLHELQEVEPWEQATPDAAPALTPRIAAHKG
jgi:anti-anti-sigma factor